MHCIGPTGHKHHFFAPNTNKRKTMLLEVHFEFFSPFYPLTSSLQSFSLFSEAVLWISPEWHKGYQRMAEVCYSERNYSDSCSWYARAMQYCPGNATCTHTPPLSLPLPLHFVF